MQYFTTMTGCPTSWRSGIRMLLMLGMLCGLHVRGHGQVSRTADAETSLPTEWSSFATFPDSTLLDTIEELKLSDPEQADTLCQTILGDREAQRPPRMMAEVFAHWGDLALTQGDFEVAKERYVNSLRMYASLPDRSPWGLEEVQIFKVVANIRLAQDDYMGAHESYKRLLHFSDSLGLKGVQAHATNNLGVLFMRLKDDVVAEKYFLEAKSLFVHLQEQYFATICDYNLALIAERKGNVTEAIELFLEASKSFMALGEWGDYMNANSAMSRCHLGAGSLDNARHFQRIALDVLNSDLFGGSAPSPLYITETLSNAANLENELGNKEMARQYAKRCYDEAVKNNLMQLGSSSSLLLSNLSAEDQRMEEAYAFLADHVRFSNLLQRESSIQEIVQLTMSHEFEKKIQAAEFLRVKEESERNRRQAFLVGALLLAVSVGLLLGWLYARQKARVAQSKLREAEWELDKQELTNSLVYKSKELTATMMYLLEKNQLLSSMARELARYKNDFSQKNQVVIQRIINELLKNSTKKAWEEFEVHFKEVHVDFYPNLQRRFPDLTLNERRLCAFLKLNLTTKEIGAITHQSSEAINMARFRLRRKLELEGDDDLVAFMGSI
jgi:DNA-binding CsgD family transcriptional regulator